MGAGSLAAPVLQLCSVPFDCARAPDRTKGCPSSNTDQLCCAGFAMSDADEMLNFDLYER